MGEKVAEFWSRQDGKIICHLCPHGCIFSQEGDIGRCRVRQRHSNSLLATGYGEISSVAVDPIEKKPLYHFFPGHSILSVGSWGCNFACDHCQNWQISQHIDYQQQLSIAELKVLTKRMQNHDQKLCGVAFT